MVSIIIPAYNSGKYIEKAIDSIYRCGFEDIEILVIDDGSCDDTVLIASQFNKVVVIKQNHKGVSAARNLGVKSAKGEYIAFLDSDDMWADDKLKVQMDYLLSNPKKDAVFTEYGNFYDDGKAHPEENKNLYLSKVMLSIVTAVFKKELFDKAGLYDESLVFGEDTEWLNRLHILGADINNVIPEVLYKRRIHGSNLSIREGKSDLNGDQPFFIKAMENLKNNGSEGPLLSVVIPAYNAEKYIGEAVESVRKQTWHGDIEIIVVDDGSTDGTKEKAIELGCIVYENEHGGAAKARNKGVKNAKGEYVLFLDADDVLCDNALPDMFRGFAENYETEIVFGKVQDFISPELSDEQKAALKVRDGVYGGILPGGSLLKRNLFEKIGYFKEDLSSAETVDWLMRLRESKAVMLNVDFTVLNRRLHLTNTGRTQAASEMKNYAALLRARMRKNKA